MRDSYEFYLLDMGKPIAIIASELMDDLLIVAATKNGVPYPPEKAIREVRLRASSKEYAAQLRQDYDGLAGEEALEPTRYVLYTNNMRTITIIHKSPCISNNGKFIVLDNFGRNVLRFPRRKFSYRMLDQLKVGGGFAINLGKWAD